MDLDAKFIAAVDVIKNLPSHGTFEVSNEMKLQFYAYYKQVTVGPCTNSRPGFWDVVNRAKHDAWAGLGLMTRDTAMTKYIDNLKSIVETMNFSPDVENFMETLGPFYEEVEEDTEEDKTRYNDQLSTIITDIKPITEERGPQMKEMLGSYDISDTSLTDETSDSDFQNENAESLRETYSGSRRGLSVSKLTDFKDNESCPNQLYEELQKTRQSLQEAKTLMNNNNTDGGESYRDNIVPVSGKLSQKEIDRMLGNIDGFIPTIGQEEDHVSDFNKKTDGHETEDEMFEDSLETLTPADEDTNSSGGHFNVEAKVITASDSSPPAAPVHIPRTKSGTFIKIQNGLEDEDEILVVTADQEDDGDTVQESVVDSPEHDENINHDINIQLAMAVDRLNSDVEHLQARIRSVETIVVMQEDKKARSSGWLFPELEPSTVVFMVTWPLVSHALIHLASAAFRKSRS